ncbi:NAD(P)-binding protein [Mycena venus]|uniref:NAD(P)-binding protein n=1 Tax=Mycena venus TaxID=2733690 RepID=A0A8H6XLL9_9AGAR|nr:NAD(P)-binding protein [Mycena venus]
MSKKIVYLISGANRGIGYGLALAIAARPNTIVFAGARNPAAQTLTDLAAKYPNVHPIKLTSADKPDNEAAIAQIGKIAGQLDVIIASAGSLHLPPYRIPSRPARDDALPAFHEHFEVNTLGPVVLFQAAHTLLLASPTGAPVFAVISSIISSMGRFLSISATPYGMSKAAVNFLVKTLDAEHPSLVTMAIEPGWVATDMGNVGAAANGLGLSQAPVTIEESVTGIMSRIDGATKEKSSGKFWNFRVGQGKPWEFDAEEIPW